jgi:type II restriction/modification system DNA methylase subunit YeeA
LLPANLVTEIFKGGVNDPEHFSETLEELFATMATGGRFGRDKIRHFNGHLFEEATVFQLDEKEISALATAGEADWQFIQPSIMGNLFERGLDPNQRAQIGAHYTSEEDILTIVEPVLMAPLRREWSALKSNLASAYAKAKGSSADRAKLTAFHNKLASITVLDPACGSGNFLYVSLKLLLDLEKEVIAFATQLGFTFKPRVNVQQLKAIELNAYAFELAQVAVQIGYLQWRRDNGFQNDEEPVLQNLDNFQNEDALLVPHFRSKPKSLKEARAGEHENDNALKFYAERKWPGCDVIVSNPPFLGGTKIWEQLGREYQSELWRIYEERVSRGADLCCYWFEKARDLIEHRDCKRAGLLATQGIRGGANRETLKRIKETGDIFFAISDREWILDGANVHVSMIAFDDRKHSERWLDGKKVLKINANLTAEVDTTEAARLRTHRELCFRGVPKVGKFELAQDEALRLLAEPNPSLRPNSDVVRPWMNGLDVTRRPKRLWIIDFNERDEQTAAQYAEPFAWVRQHVLPMRIKNKRGHRRQNYWLHAETGAGLRAATDSLARFLATLSISKHRIFVWLQQPTFPDQQLYVFARDDDYFFGVLHSRFHEVWALKLGTRLETRPRYTPTTSFETFPFPEPTNEQTIDISTAAKELNELRENWLNPLEWTITRILEFPGATDGPWSRFVVDPDTRGIGTVRYPRVEARDDDCAKKLAKRTLTNLYNERPAWLANAHAKLDAAVAAAYGFPVDLTDEQILERLLFLNLERAAGEQKSSGAPKKRSSRARTAEEMI